MLPACATPNISRPIGAQTSPAGRIHRLWRLFAARSSRLDAPTLRTAADFLDLPGDMSFEGVADALQDVVAGAGHPLAAAANASAAAMKLLCDAPRVDAEIFALWLADLALAQRLRARQGIAKSVFRGNRYWIPGDRAAS